MDFRQCKNCRKLFQYRNSPLCPDCVNELDRLFEAVRNYIYENPRSSTEEICAETGADSQMLYGWLREGRLILGKDSAKLLVCESCGQPISLGRYCDACSSDVRNQLEGAAKSLDAMKAQPRPKAGDKDGPRMHVDFRKG